MDHGRHPLSRAGWLLVLLACVPSAGRAAEGRGSAPVVIQRAQGKALGFPSDVAVDRRGVSFLLDAGSRSILIFSPQGAFLREIPGRGTWKDPQALALSPDGAIFIADGDSGRVLELDMSGKLRRDYDAGKGSRLTGVTVFGDSIYCVDNRNDKVIVFRRGGARKDAWGKRGDGPGEFRAPYRVAADLAGRIFVTDVMNARVQWFSAFGQNLGTLKKFGAGEGRFVRPTGISPDTRGRIWVTDSYTGLVQLFEESGVFVKALSSEGRPHVFADPTGVAVTAESVWVADQKDGKTSVFRK